MPAKIVVVDDHRQLDKLIEQLQRRAEYEVAYCALDAEAFKCIQEQTPDVVVLDLADIPAPGLNLLTIIRSDSTLSVTPIVVWAVPSTDITELLAQLAMMRLYVLPSPSSTDQMIAKIEEALAKSHPR